MLKLVRFLKPYTWYLVILAVFTYLQVMANLKLPEYIASIVNKGILGKDMNSIYQNGGIMLLITLAGGACAVVVGYLAARIATGASRDMRKKVFEKVESFSINEFNHFSTASLITRSTNDVQQVQMTLIMMFRLVLMAPFMAVGALQNALLMAPSMSWIIAVATGALLTMIVALFAVGMPKFKLLQQMVDRLNLVTRENLTGLRVVRAFNKESREQAKFEKANEDLTKLNLFVNRLMVILQPVMMLIMNLAMVAIVWFGAKLIDTGDLQIGNMLAFMQYAIQVIMSFLLISIVFIMIPRASVSANRIAEVLATEPTIKDPEEFTPLNKQGLGRVEFKGVNFAYPDAEVSVLKDINFVAEPGQTTAIIGSTGSGKTTLINLIPRFYDATAGQVLVDGVDVRKVKLEELYKQIGYVPQRAVLFSGTVNSNIKYGNKEASEGDVKKAASVAQATEFIRELKHGYDDEIAQGGANVSGGQKQRFSIARALAVKPKIYIFDDSFSSLDFKTDSLLREALEKETKGKTVIIVGQRISTIAGADKIIVLEEGRVVGSGRHEELLKGNKVYREIAYSQLSDEELKAATAGRGLGAGKGAK